MHVADPRAPWSVAAARVLRIVPLADHPAPALDVLAAVGAPTGAVRVMILRGAGGGELAVLAGGAIDIAEVDPADILPLPDTFAAATPQIAAIVVAPDRSLSLLLQPSAEEPCPSRS